MLLPSFIKVRRMITTALAVSTMTAVAVVGSVSTSSAASDVVAAAKANVDKYIAGTETNPPASGPKAVAGKSIFVISCGQVVPGCSLQTNAAVEAGKVLGWNVTLVDGAFNANGAYGKGVRQAIAAHADGVIVVSIDCNVISQPLREANAAGLKVVGQNSFDCDERPSLLTSMKYSAATPDLASYGQAAGAAQADYIIAKTDGKAKILEFRFIDNTFAIQSTKGFETEISKCANCEAKNADIALSDYGTPTGFARKAETALLGAKDFDVVRVPFDSFITSGVGQAVVHAGKQNDMLVVGAEGFEANLNLIREKRGQSVAIASDQEWIGWGSADALNRLFAGVEPAVSGIGFKLVDIDHNLPASGSYKSSIDFKSAYKAVWGK
jgi:ribose transport system substrate-binding protein